MIIYKKNAKKMSDNDWNSLEKIRLLNQIRKKIEKIDH